MKLRPFEITAVDVRDLEFPTRRRLELGRHVDHLVVVESTAQSRRTTTSALKVFFKTNRVAGFVELDDPITLGIPNLIPEYGRSSVTRNGAPEVV